MGFPSFPPSALPTVGSGLQIGDGDIAEALLVGNQGQPVIVGAMSTSTVGFYGTTPVVQGLAITTLATTPTATDIAVAVNALIARLKTIGITL